MPAVLLTHLAYPRFSGGILTALRTYGNDAMMVFFVLSGYMIAHTASTRDKDIGSLKTGADKAAAAAVGKLLAERARKAGVTDVVFDRGSYLFHGRVKALSDAARESGLKF